MKFSVRVTIEKYIDVEVEADDPETAVEIAYKQVESLHPEADTISSDISADQCEAHYQSQLNPIGDKR